MCIPLKKCLPFLLTLFVIIADQTSKYIIVNNWPIPEDSAGRMISDVFNNDILQIVHVRNKAIAFSLGAGLPDLVKPALFIVLPILVLLFLVVYYFKSNDWTTAQRWALGGILGGGAGNLIDRIYPHGGVAGVVDFISVKFWGIFGMERWPTFNIADASVVISVIFWFITLLATSKSEETK